MSEDNPEPFVTQAFCDERFGQHSKHVYEKLDTILAELNDMKKERRKEKAQEKDMSLKYKAAIISALILGGSSVLAEFLRIIASAG